MNVPWKLLEQVFTVETIMTPREDLITADDPEAASLRRVDTLPVVDERGQIVAVKRPEHPEPVPLTQQWIISRDTSIPTLLEIFAMQEIPALFVLRGQDIIGVVTPSDLNRLPARTYFFNLLAELETRFARLVRQHVGSDSATVLALLNKDDDMQAVQRKLEASQLELDIVHLLYLSDLVNLVQSHDGLREALGFGTKTLARKHLNGLVHLRNDVMHPSRLILSNEVGIHKLHRRVTRLLTLLEHIHT